MTSKPILTIAIPAYNVELFLEETIESITKSKYIKDIEILIVNDGSKDKTLDIAKKLAEKCSSIKIIDKKNGGHGSTINASIKKATGKYYRLLDGDDWFNTDELDCLVARLKNENSDMILTDLVECFIKSNYNRPVTYYSNLPEYTKLDLHTIAFTEWGPMLPTTTIKTSLLQKLNFKIDENCFYVDQEYNMACYLCAKTVIYYPLMIYHYRLEREGQSMEKGSLIRNVKSHETVCARLLKEYNEHYDDFSKQGRTFFENRIIIPMCHMQYMIAIEWCKSKENFLSFDKILKKYPKFYNNPGITGTITNLHRKTKGSLIKIDAPIRKIAVIKNKRHNISISPTSKKKRLFLLASFLIVILLINLVAINYVKTEQTVYFWDYSGYWKPAINLVDIAHTEGLHGILRAINVSMTSDYNYLPLLPILPFLLIFGTSRMAFILIILNVYIVPFALLMTYVTIVLFRSTSYKVKTWVKPLLLVTYLFLPSILIPVFNGRPDAICLVIVALILLLLAKTRLECISNYFTLSILTFLLIILRRYFSIFALSLYTSILIVKTIINLYSFKQKKTAVIKSIKVGLKLLISGLFMLLLMSIFSRSLLSRYITGGYSDTYSAYMFGDLFNQILLFIKYHGVIILSLSLIGIVFALKKYNKTNVSEITLIGLFTSVIAFLLFSGIQTLGDQHMYMFAPFIALTISIFIVTISLANKRQVRVLSIIPVIIICSLSIFSFNGEKTECGNNCYITGISESVRPSVRHDLNKLEELDNYLSKIMTANDYVYVLSSSETFNEDVLNNLHFPATPKYNLSGVKHVDKRDGFPSYFFDATYIIVADPIQTHLSDGGQDVIVKLAEEILSNKTNNLDLIKTYQIDNNVTLKLYHKEFEYSKTLQFELYQYFKTKYPEYHFLYDSIPHDC